MRHVATAADRIDYWIRRHIVACATPSNALAADLHVGLAAIGRSLRDQYDALAAQDTATSDGYATGFVVYVLRRAGVPTDDARLRKAVAWLKANQRRSGRWFTRSANRDGKHYISHAGTAFAVMALAECGEIKKTTARR